MAGVEKIDFRHILSGFGQKFLCFVQVVRIALDGFIFAPHAFRHGTGKLLAPAFHSAVDDGIVVNGIGKGLAEYFIAGRQFLVVQVYDGAEEGRIFINMDGFVILQLVDLVHGNAFGNVNIPLFQLQPLGRRIFDAVEEDMFDRRHLACIIFLYVQFDGLAGGVGRDFIGTGTHGVGGQVGGAHIVILCLVHDLRIHDGRTIHCQGVEEGRKGFVQLENDSFIIRRFDGFHHFEIIGRSFLHFLYPFDGELHRFGIHWRTVGKFMSLIQSKGPGESVIADGPGLGQRWFHLRGGLAVCHLVFHQPFIGGIGNLPALVVHGHRRVQSLRIHCHAHHNGVLRHGAAGRRTSRLPAAACQTKDRQAQKGTGQYSFQKFFHSLSPLRKKAAVIKDECSLFAMKDRKALPALRQKGHLRLSINMYTV